MKKSIILAALLAASSSAMAVESENLYAGGGLGFNSIDVSGADSAMGFQFFGGYTFDLEAAPTLNFAAEAGYMTSGDFDVEFVNPFTGAKTTVSGGSADGIWMSGVASYPMNDQLSLIGRIGLDFGDDDGVLFGFGAGYSLGKSLGVRGEYVLRDSIDSLQINATFKL